MPNILLRAPLGFLFFTLIACSGAPPVPKDHFYRLTLSPQDITEISLPVDMVYVGPFVAEGLYNERALLYTGDSGIGELHQHHYHFWLTSPPRLLHDHFVHFLRDAGTSSMIATEPGMGDDIQIFGRLNAFESINEGGQSWVNMAVEFRVNNKLAETPLLIKEYRVKEMIEGKATLPNTVAAFDRATLRLYSEFLTDLQNELKRSQN